MKRSQRAWVAVVALACAAAAPAPAQRKGKSPAAGAAMLVEEKGRFRIIVDGQSVGVEEFQIAPAGAEWQARGNVEIGSGASRAKLSGRLRLQADGTPLAYELELAGEDGKHTSAAVVFQGGTAVMEARLPGAGAAAQFGANLGEAQGEGVRVSEVPRDSAADRAGLKPGDVIRKLDGQPVKNLEELNARLREKGQRRRLVLTVAREVSEMNVNLDPMPFTQQFSFDTPRVVILDNNLYHHYAILARMYDWKARGAQTFPVLIPQDMTPGLITVESAGQQEVGGGKLDVLKVRTADLEIELYVDPSRRLVRLAVPASKAEVIRE